MSDGLLHLVGLAGAIANGQSNAGNRKDGQICTAQAGECRHNSRYYTLGMNDAKSWSMPCADDSCSSRCPYLRDEPVQTLPEEERRRRAFELIGAIARKQEVDKLGAALLLGSLGLDPRDALDE